MCWRISFQFKYYKATQRHRYQILFSLYYLQTKMTITWKTVILQFDLNWARKQHSQWTNNEMPVTISSSFRIENYSLALPSIIIIMTHCLALRSKRRKPFDIRIDNFFFSYSFHLSCFVKHQQIFHSEIIHFKIPSENDWQNFKKKKNCSMN